MVRENKIILRRPTDRTRSIKEYVKTHKIFQVTLLLHNPKEFTFWFSKSIFFPFHRSLLGLVHFPSVNTSSYPRELNSKCFSGESAHLRINTVSGGHICTTWSYPFRFRLQLIGPGNRHLAQAEPIISSVQGIRNWGWEDGAALLCCVWTKRKAICREKEGHKQLERGERNQATWRGKLERVAVSFPNVILVTCSHFCCFGWIIALSFHDTPSCSFNKFFY